MKFLSPRNRIAAGLTGAVIFVICLAKITGYIPDQRSLLASARTDLSETIAMGSSSLIVNGDVDGLKSFLEGVSARNNDVQSFAVRLSTGELAAETNDHALHWVPSTSERSSESQIQVPIYSSTNDKWGTVEIRFTPSANGLLGFAKMLDVGQMFFIASSCFLIFSFILSLVLKHLDPSKAVPQRVRDALDNLAEGLLILDTKYNILLANSSFAGILGKDPEKLVGLKTGSLNITTDGEPPWEAALSDQRLISNQRVALEDTNGNELKYLVNCSPLLGHKGNYCGVMVTFDDVTELEEARDAADAANQAKSDFLANMSHEIRTPMNAILGFTDVLRRGMEENPEQRIEYLNTIHSSGNHLIGLINEILDLSKVEAGKLELEMLEFNLPELLNNVVQVLSSKATQKDIDLKYEVVGKIPVNVTSDSTRIRQILINLVGNAVKFTEIGGVKLSCDYEHGNIRLHVTDTGIGMTGGHLEKIFDPFSQADSSVTRRFGGTGLGLSICKKFAEALDGSISVKSELGTGTTFSVCLPIEAGDSELLDHAECEKHVQNSLQTKPSFENRELKKVTVLVVDDGQTNRHIVSVVLKRKGLNILEAENGQVACDIVQEHDVDIVLMDMQMPVMDGYTATRTIRELGFDLPVIALTGNVSEEDELKSNEAGCNGLLPKPINIDQMIETIGGFVGFEDESTPKLEPATAEPAVPVPAVCLDQPVVVETWTTTLPMDDEDFYQIVADFVDNLGGRLQGMQTMLDESDLSALADEAHWLKGSAGTVGLAKFTEPSAALEKSAKKSNIKECQRLLTEIVSLAGAIRLRESDAEPAPAKVEPAVPVPAVCLDQPVDVETWTTTLPMDDEDFYQIVADFVDNLGGRLQGMQTMLDESDLSALADEAHWLKGSAGTVGLAKFTEPSAALEKSAKKSNIKECQRLLTEIVSLAGAIRLRESDAEPAPAKVEPAVPVPAVCLDQPVVVETWTTTLPMDDEDFYQIVADFVDNLGGRLQGMQTMLDESDLPALADEAHWLKGSAGTVGLGKFTEPSAALEKSAKKSNIKECQRLLTEIVSLAGAIRLRESDAEPAPAKVEPAVPVPAVCLDQPDEVESWTTTLPMDDEDYYLIVAGFVDSLQVRLDGMQGLLEGSDMPALIDEAHWLKGAAGSVGLGKFTEPSAELEKSAKNSDVEKCQQLLTEIVKLASAIRLRESEHEGIPS